MKMSSHKTQTDTTSCGQGMDIPATATITVGDRIYEAPVMVGSEGEIALDISNMRNKSGLITLDQGFGNTGSCKSSITFVDGEKGVLRYRGYPIEQLAKHSTFVETAMLLIFGELPKKDELNHFRSMLRHSELLHEDLLHHFNGFPPNGHPMAILSAVVNSMSSYQQDLLEVQHGDKFRLAAANLMSKVRTIAAFAYRKSTGLPVMYPDPKKSYCVNFLHMMFSIPFKPYNPPLGAVRAVTLYLSLHADHEQNSSTSTVRMGGSTQPSRFAAISSGICALWGPLHGGANTAVVRMLENIHEGQMKVKDCIEMTKQRKFRLMGFGHRIYKSFDPRAKILKKAAFDLLLNLGGSDPLLDIALELEEAALSDDYFIERRLYPNVDFYSGIILRALGIPVPMFPVMFAIGRLPGWIAHWYEEYNDPVKIHRPRQVYMGPVQRDFVSMDQR